MASYNNFHFILIILFSLFSLIFKSESQVNRAPFKPNALVLPVYKDNATALHVTNIRKRTPQVSLPFLVDLNGKFLWVNCEQNYLSSTYNAPFCHSTQCSRAGVHYCHKCSSTVRPGCHNNTCAVITTNPLTRQNVVSELAQDVVSIQSDRGSSNAGQVVTVPDFVFACAPSSLLKGPMPRNVQGVVGLGYTPVALPLQLASHFGFPPRFALCLPSSSNKSGAIVFGNAPRPSFQPGIDVSKLVGYTPLTIGAQGEYFIVVRSIRINNKPIQFNRSFLSSTRSFSGTIITTTSPYTVLEHSVFQNFTQFFASQLSGVPQVQAVSPFGVCFDSSKLRNTRVGPQVPNIDFVLQNRNVTWTISGTNSMVQARPGVSCLAFVDGGTNTRAPIVIGAHQLQDNFLQFDLVRSRLSFTTSLLSQGTSCANFNFTSSFTSDMD